MTQPKAQGEQPKCPKCGSSHIVLNYNLWVDDGKRSPHYARCRECDYTLTVDSTPTDFAQFFTHLAVSETSGGEPPNCEKRDDFVEQIIEVAAGANLSVPEERAHMREWLNARIENSASSLNLEAIDKFVSRMSQSPTPPAGSAEAFKHRPDKAEHGSCLCLNCQIDKSGIDFGLFDLMSPEQVKWAKQFAAKVAAQQHAALVAERDEYKRKWNDMLTHEAEILANGRKLERDLAEARKQSQFSGDEPEFLDAMNYGSTTFAEKLLEIAANGQDGKFVGIKEQAVADWIAAHRKQPSAEDLARALQKIANFPYDHSIPEKTVVEMKLIAKTALTPVWGGAGGEMKWLKRLFCRHTSAEFIRNIYGDEINTCSGKRSLWRCNDCGALVLLNALGPCPHTWSEGNKAWGWTRR